MSGSSSYNFIFKELSRSEPSHPTRRSFLRTRRQSAIIYRQWDVKRDTVSIPWSVQQSRSKRWVAVDSSNLSVTKPSPCGCTSEVQYATHGNISSRPSSPHENRITAKLHQRLPAFAVAMMGDHETDFNCTHNTWKEIIIFMIHIYNTWMKVNGYVPVKADDKWTPRKGSWSTLWNKKQRVLKRLWTRYYIP